MLATMRYITPEITSTLLGVLSLPMDIKFTDVPNGLAATSMLATMCYIASKIPGKPPELLVTSYGYQVRECAKQLGNHLQDD